MDFLNLHNPTKPNLHYFYLAKDKLNQVYKVGHTSDPEKREFELGKHGFEMILRYSTYCKRCMKQLEKDVISTLKKFGVRIGREGARVIFGSPFPGWTECWLKSDFDLLEHKKIYWDDFFFARLGISLIRYEIESSRDIANKPTIDDLVCMMRSLSRLPEKTNLFDEIKQGGNFYD